MRCPFVGESLCADGGARGGSGSYLLRFTSSGGDDCGPAGSSCLAHVVCGAHLSLLSP